MPVRKLMKASPPAEAARLRQRLATEWANANSTADQPVILEDGGASQPLRIYVIWDDWARLSQVERSEIIMDAFEDRYGQQKGLDVTVAMGLTSEEAERLGIQYQ